MHGDFADYRHFCGTQIPVSNTSKCASFLAGDAFCVSLHVPTCLVTTSACFGGDVLVCVFVCKWSLVEASLSKMLHLIPIRQAVPPAHIPPVCLLECVSVHECVSAWPVAWYQICLSLSFALSLSCNTLEFSLITFSVAFLFFSLRV